MNKKIYWKTIRQSLLSSKGRFFSIFNLMMIGSMAFIGLKVAAPNMEKTAQRYIEQGQVMDLAVMSDLGISQADKKELDRIRGVQIEYAYFKDVTIGAGQEAIRLFSAPKTISRYQLKEGKDPASAREILLSTNLKGTYQIGDRITVQEGNKQARVLKETAFIVTGFADSAEIWGSINLGPASTGTGQLAAYAFVDEAAFDSEVYMMARLRYNDLAAVPYYQAEYKKKVTAYQTTLNEALSDNGKERLASVQKDGQEKIHQANRKIAEADEQLQEAQTKLDAKETELNQGQLRIDQGQEEVDLQTEKMAQIEESLLQAQDGLDSSRNQLEATKKELDNQRSKLDKSRQELGQAEAKLVKAESDLKNKEAELERSAAQIASLQMEFERLTKMIQDQITFALAAGDNPGDLSELVEAQLQLKQLEGDLARQQQAYQEGQAAYEVGKAQYEQESVYYQIGIQQLELGEEQYQLAQTAYQEGEKAYQEGLAQYESGRLAYEAGLEQVTLARSSLKEQQTALNQGRAAFQTAQQEFEKKRISVEQELTKSRKEIQVAQADLARLDTPEYRTYTRDSLPGGNGYANYDSSTKSISAVGNIFPAVLYLVAALVTFMTMTRFVDEERSNIGIFKALGYTNRQIIIKFIVYGLASGLSGTIVGLLLGNFLLAPMISRIITDTTVIGRSGFSFYPKWYLLAILFSLLASVLPAYWVVRRELKDKPAQLLQAKPPVSGAKIFLEYVPIIWQRLSFTQKVTARNILRYKKRMLMTIIGVAGSVALLFAGLGIRSSISQVIDRQFQDLLHYQLVLVKQSRVSQEDKDQVEKALRSPVVQKTLPIAYYGLTETVKGQDDALAISLFISPEKDLSSFVTLRNPKNGQGLLLSDEGAIISQKLAQLYQVDVGDRLTVKVQQEELTLKVAGITEMYAGHFIYLSDVAYQRASGKGYQANADLVMLDKSDKKAVEKVARDFLAMKGVVAVVQNLSLVTLLETIVQSLQSVMLILIVLSILLGIVILYNLTTINMAERIRELSTIKVLGFYDREVTFYIYRETMILSVLGIALGLCAGFFLHRLLLVVIASPAILFAPTVSIDVYLVPIVAVLGILTLLGWLVHHHLSQLDMLEALKSGE
ncbi:FtsX-like permease family protein [Streptococcus sp. zg-86]|uniref:FtsX-like permease family protein n=1 Tax=Streptococcus zhangguiae TaxID=2664091 RepID=A0A6I4RFZ9_9STRE|nr:MULTISPECIES: FtsX-like permease family protein [unclassified Streptococcus]MTB64823.1 FtsX-like permease family protein [Streptococcus sp. zg-86]MTB91107.1 FtsX-like permease family protein [Streptococcus sp. zg-36]MWV56810.1 FtsX-like permease family protein [Streptococcus sp. zg-70]QTH48382.1 FtsX-like permease family protein [Streptococcus sp. zg-86]